jgi:hypothetical protein
MLEEHAMKAYKIVAPDSTDTLRLGRSPDT